MAWGDVPTWLGAVATVLAVVFVAFQYVNFLRAASRQQASLVAVWASSYRYSSDVRTGDDNEAEAVVYNGSDLPIYDCRLSLLPWDWERRGRFRDDDERLDGCVFTVIAPKSTTKPENIDRGLVRPPQDVGAKVALHPPYQVEFRDAANQRWVRRPNGNLRRIKQ